MSVGLRMHLLAIVLVVKMFRMFVYTGGYLRWLLQKKCCFVLQILGH